MQEILPEIEEIIQAGKSQREIIDQYIHFYNHERIQIKTGVVPLTLCHSY